MLVTGASGFLGTHLCRRLADGGAQVHALSRSARESETPRVRWHQGDMADLAFARRLLDEIRPGVVFHLAGQVTARPDRELVLSLLNSLFLSTVNVLTAASDIGGCRVVAIGSLTEPGPSDPDPVPSSPYAAAKWASTAYARMFHSLYGTPVVVVRPFMTYGPRQDVTKFIPYVTLSLLRGEAPKLASGRWETDWVYVSDVVDGMIAAALVPGIEGSIVELGSGRLVSLRTIAETLAPMIDGGIQPAFGALPDRPLEPVRPADCDATFERVGWRATTSLEDGLRQTVEWYRANMLRA